MFADLTANVIVLNKTEAKNAGNPTTAEFKELVALRTAFSDFSIEVRAERRKGDSYKGLTKEYMLSYIDKHDGEKAAENKAFFYELLGCDADGKKVACMKTHSYGEIKMWFLETHPEIEEANKKADDMLNSIKEKRAERKAAAKAAA